MVRVGIPRGLYFYKYYPMWEIFFTQLGAEIVVSDKTNKSIIENGVNACVSEACLPIKAYFGHVINLVGKVDYIFMPRFTSVSKKQYICPEICGLPDMVKNTIKVLPRIIDTEINIRDDYRSSWKAALHAGSFITNNRSEIRSAYNDAIKVYQCERQIIKNGIIPSDEPDTKMLRLLKKPENVLSVAVIGHNYNVYDSFLNMELLKKLKSAGIGVVTLDMLDYMASKEICQRDLYKQFFWDYGTRAYGGSAQLVEQHEVDGIIALTSFGCGVDSFVDELVEKKIRDESDIPFMKLVLDEHSAEAGLCTRLEAFIDMLHRRKA